MLAKVIAYGRTRAEAAARLARVLERTQVHGVITNRNLLAAILREPEFVAGGTDTGYLTRHHPAELAAPDPAVTAVHALAAALAGQAARRATATVLATLPSGWRNVRSADQHTSYEAAGQRVTVAYRLDTRSDLASPTSTAAVHATVDGKALGGRITAYAITPDGVDLDINGVRRRYAVHRVGTEVYVDGGGTSTAFAEVPRFPPPGAAGHAGSLVAPTPGMVVRVLAAEGDQVTAGQPLVVLEAMKMEHTVTAPVDGTLTALRVAAGEQLATGQIIATVEETTLEDTVLEDTGEEK
jgi:propionyl-CoA carboxylase alpha chain